LDTKTEASANETQEADEAAAKAGYNCCGL